VHKSNDLAQTPLLPCYFFFSQEFVHPIFDCHFLLSFDLSGSSEHLYGCDPSRELRIIDEEFPTPADDTGIIGTDDDFSHQKLADRRHFKSFRS